MLRPIVLACCESGAVCVAAAGIHCTRVYREVAHSETFPAIGIVQLLVMLDLISMKSQIWAKTMYTPRLQHFIQKAMHAHPSCRGTATDLLSHQWILTNTGQEVTPHWAPPEPAFAQSQIPGPPAKAAADAAAKPLETAARMHQYKFASGIDPDAAAVAMARGNEISRTATWDAASSARPDTKHRLDSQVSAVRGGGVSAARCAGGRGCGRGGGECGRSNGQPPPCGRPGAHLYSHVLRIQHCFRPRWCSPQTVTTEKLDSCRVARASESGCQRGSCHVWWRGADLSSVCGGAAQFCQVILDRAHAL